MYDSFLYLYFKTPSAMRKIVVSFAFLFPVFCFGQQLKSLTVEKIMRDPKWIGASPSSPFWDADGQQLYFQWNPDQAADDSLYSITIQNPVPKKVPFLLKNKIVSADRIKYNKAKTAYVYAQDGDIFYKKIKENKTIQVTQTAAFETNPVFSFNDEKIVYELNQNLYAWDIATGQLSQLSNFTSGEDQKEKSTLPPQEDWLKKDQITYLQVLKERKEKREATQKYNDLLAKDELKKIYIGDKRMINPSINADGSYIAYRLYKSGPRKGTIVPNYITESGYTTDIQGRPKVGESPASMAFYLYSLQRDSAYKVDIDSLPGIRDVPAFYQDYPKELAAATKANKIRGVGFVRYTWSPDNKNIAIDIRSDDNKDRWLARWDTATKKLTLIDRQHDDAWIDGPGSYNQGWLDNDHFWFQSEVTGYAHLYSVDIYSGKRKVFTSGNYEVQNAILSSDKKYFYITTNKDDPGQHQYYRLSISDSRLEKITQLTGANEITLSPDEKNIAILYSYSNKPWELYLQSNKPGTAAQQITFKSESAEFKTYPWRDPKIITFAARDGATVYGRVYTPENAKPGMPAVVFVHGAGYLQNAHKWWSSYFREYMFHNLLADKGYYVIDIDYRGSAGYGRDWRTGIYRHMGGKDLTDNVDAANYLVKTYGVDASRIGIYGGSYGGFITLMAMFTTPDVFAAGAGLRSVTDWANYNHGYTSNILNEPFNDSIAYHKSSPIYYADGLKGHLLMCHGMVDENVHFQDIVKLSQRLIELHKDNWELAVYPMEDHGFVEPSSWTDEYKRILKLFETVLKR